MLVDNIATVKKDAKGIRGLSLTWFSRRRNGVKTLLLFPTSISQRMKSNSNSLTEKPQASSEVVSLFNKTALVRGLTLNRHCLGLLTPVTGHHSSVFQAHLSSSPVLVAQSPSPFSHSADSPNLKLLSSAFGVLHSVYSFLLSLHAHFVHSVPSRSLDRHLL